MDEAGDIAQTRCEYIHVSSASSIPAVEGLRNDADSILKVGCRTKSLTFPPHRYTGKPAPIVMPESPRGLSGIQFY